MEFHCLYRQYIRRTTLTIGRKAQTETIKKRIGWWCAETELISSYHTLVVCAAIYCSRHITSQIPCLFFYWTRTAPSGFCSFLFIGSRKTLDDVVACRCGLKGEVGKTWREKTKLERDEQYRRRCCLRPSYVMSASHILIYTTLLLSFITL